MTICRESDNVIIAGNGPSLARTDYRRLPQDFDIFRCNQFYFEPNYFLGNKIKAVFFNYNIFFEQYITTQSLQERGEYFIDHINYSTFEYLDEPNLVDYLQRVFPDAINGNQAYLKPLPDFYHYLRKQALIKGKHITNGVYMCAAAVASGYRKIFLSGLDFYTTGKAHYAFDTRKPSLFSINPGFINLENVVLESSAYQYHSKQTDLDALFFLQKEYDVEIYALAEQSVLAEYFPLADVSRSDIPDIFGSAKPDNYIDDLQIPTSQLYLNYRQTFFPQPEKIKKNNIYYRLVYDLLHLPSDIRKYLREKRGKREVKSDDRFD